MARMTHPLEVNTGRTAMPCACSVKRVHYVMQHTFAAAVADYEALSDSGNVAVIYTTIFVNIVFL